MTMEEKIRYVAAIEATGPYNVMSKEEIAQQRRTIPCLPPPESLRAGFEALERDAHRGLFPELYPISQSSAGTKPSGMHS